MVEDLQVIVESTTAYREALEKVFNIAPDNAMTQDIRRLIEDSRVAVDAGIQRTKVAQDTIERVVRAISQRSTEVRQVATALTNESATADRLANSLHEMETATQQNAAMI
ncbi:MAG: hypothetical protein ABI605_13165 [Rhizobacter sp.]